LRTIERIFSKMLCRSPARSTRIHSKSALYCSRESTEPDGTLPVKYFPGPQTCGNHRVLPLGTASVRDLSETSKAILRLQQKGGTMPNVKTPLRVTTLLGLSLLSGTSAWAEERWLHRYGTCSACCSDYPSGWRGMCLRRCLAVRPRGAGWRALQCECSVNWLGAWRCG
jgi:hypothetical protein